MGLCFPNENEMLQGLAQLVREKDRDSASAPSDALDGPLVPGQCQGAEIGPWQPDLSQAGSAARGLVELSSLGTEQVSFSTQKQGDSGQPGTVALATRTHPGPHPLKLLHTAQGTQQALNRCSLTHLCGSTSPLGQSGALPGARFEGNSPSIRKPGTGLSQGNVIRPPHQ